MTVENLAKPFSLNFVEQILQNASFSKFSDKKFLTVTDIYTENGKQQATITKKSPAGWLGRAFYTALGKRQNLQAKSAEQ